LQVNFPLTTGIGITEIGRPRQWRQSQIRDDFSHAPKPPEAECRLVGPAFSRPPGLSPAFYAACSSGGRAPDFFQKVATRTLPGSAKTGTGASFTGGPTPLAENRLRRAAWRRTIVLGGDTPRNRAAAYISL